MLRLVFNPGTPQAQEILLKPGDNFLGRGFSNDFQIQDASVSTSHCQITVVDGSICVKDLGSTNGTFVDGVQIDEAFVRPGQQIRIGSVDLALCMAEPVPAHVEPELALAGASAESPALEFGHSGSASHTFVSVSPAPVGAEESAPLFCKNHYQNAARHKCPKCQRYFCDLCVNTRGSSAGGLKFCKVCSSQCVPVSVSGHVPKPVNFFQSVPQSFKYPFVGDGLILLFGGTIFFGILDAANYISLHASMYGMRAMTIRAVIITFVLGTGYLFSYLKKVIYSTAGGDKQLPDWPELSEWHADIVSPMFQLVIVSLFSFGPALAFAVWSEGEYPWMVWTLALMGCFYFPMGLLGVAMFDTLAALNPLFVIGSILKVPREYCVAVLVFAAIIGVRWLCETLIKLVLPIPLVPALIADLIGLYLLIVETRILGLLYLTRKASLGWFKH